ARRRGCMAARRRDAGERVTPAPAPRKNGLRRIASRFRFAGRPEPAARIRTASSHPHQAG
ncbi:hypothetical protein K6W80_40430, partial [Burkholderia contaminans]|uniref:hypothetical protein n=1 Tax=Burkholderia contaminans TaxID=488447 RepID=UPI001C945DE1